MTDTLHKGHKAYERDFGGSSFLDIQDIHHCADCDETVPPRYDGYQFITACCGEPCHITIAGER